MWHYHRGPLFGYGVAKVIDGDNIEIGWTNWRLVGINAPELPVVDGKECRVFRSRPGCEERASIALDEFLAGRSVTCWWNAYDLRNERPVGSCSVGGVEISEWLLRNCHAGSPKKPAHRVDHYEKIIANRMCPAKPKA